MTHPWIEQYLLLCLQIDRALGEQGIGPFLDSYYGPPALKAQAQAEPPEPLDHYAARVNGLLDSLSGQGFEQQRAIYLEKQLVAVATQLRIFAGAEVSLKEAAHACLDVDLAPKPESDFQQALALYKQALPGPGSLGERYAHWLGQGTLPAEKAEEVVGLMRRILAENRRRTQALEPLPEEESVEIKAVQDKPYGAANWYEGHYHSRLELNISRPVNIPMLQYQMSHEIYPGHHTEYALKERRLVHELRREEMTAFISLSPQLVISEGFASLAFDTIFSPSEAAQWVVENFFSPSGIHLDEIDLPALYQAGSLSRLDDLSGNFVLLAEQGYSDEQLVEYAMSFGLIPESLVRQFLSNVRDPFRRIYNLSYYQGVRLMQPHLQGEGRLPFIRRILTEQVYPSQLAI